MDYKDKIHKLLALAESPNEAEAKAALLKARELMAKHKLTEADVVEKEKQKVRNILTKFTASKRRDPWLIDLSAIIAGHYCCKAYRSKYYGKQTYTVGFIGLEDDVELCVEIFGFAVECIAGKIKEIKAQLKTCDWYSNERIGKECISYAFGFVRGIMYAFDHQDRSSEVGLVLVVPSEVKKASGNMKNGVPFVAAAASSVDRVAYAKGMCDGRNFDPTKHVTAGEDPQTIVTKGDCT